MHLQSTPVQLPLFAFDKRCAKCGTTKPLEQFFRQSAATDGHHRWCKACCAEHQQNRYAAKGDDLRANARAYYYVHREEKLAYNRVYNEANRERIAARAQAYNAAHTEQRKEQWQRWYAANREQQLAAASAYHAAHRDEARRYRQAYWPVHYAANKQRYIARAAAWAKAHPERVKQSRKHAATFPANQAKRRVRKALRRSRAAQATGFFTAADIHALAVQQQGLCAYCGLAYGAYHVDHKLPLARGGSNWPDNLALTCGPCNMSKGAKTDGEFREWLALRASNVRTGNRIG